MGQDRMGTYLPLAAIPIRGEVNVLWHFKRAAEMDAKVAQRVEGGENRVVERPAIL